MALMFPNDLMTRGSGFLQFSCNNLNESGQNNTVQLPLPPTLTFTDAMSYENVNMGAVMGMIADGKTMADVAAGLRAAGAKFDGLTLETAKDIAGDIMAKMGVKTAQVRKTTVPNPNTRALFKSPNPRQFEFQFELVATRSSDKVLIENIREFFRVNMYPADENPNIPLMYKMPNIFSIQAFLLTPKGGHRPLKNFKIKECYLSSLTTALDGKAILAEYGDNPFFAQTSLSLTFMEEKTLVTKDVSGGY